MDILTHSLSGLAAASAFVHLEKRGPARSCGILISGAAGGLMPDIDTVTLWTFFDPFIGKFFGLTASGRHIYFSNYWYSHHNFFHSIASAIFFTSMVALIFYFFCCGKSSFKTTIYNNALIPLSFFSGYLLHLIGDLPTPACVWNGINLLWPLNIYTGGTGYTWWWNNYDIFIIALFCIIINITLKILFRILHFRFISIPFSVLIISFALAFNQISERNNNFNYRGFTKRYHEYEMQSLAIQKEILGPRIFAVMRHLDSLIKFNF